MSSLKTGLTGGAVLLSDADAAAYDALVSRLVKYFDPVGDDERALVQSIAHTDWRLARIPALEAGIYAVGRLEFAALFAAEQDEVARRHLLDAKVFLAYLRPLNSLSVQEARLRRQREKDVNALRDLQNVRERARKGCLDQAANANIDTVYHDRQDGFDTAAERTCGDLAPLDQREVSADVGASRVSVVREFS